MSPLSSHHSDMTSPLSVKPAQPVVALSRRKTTSVKHTEVGLHITQCNVGTHFSIMRPLSQSNKMCFIASRRKTPLTSNTWAILNILNNPPLGNYVVAVYSIEANTTYCEPHRTWSIINILNNYIHRQTTVVAAYSIEANTTYCEPHRTWSIINIA